jgi:hypothetical protein
MNREETEEFEEAFGSLCPFYRDTHLAEEVLAMYEVGTILREPTFCDTSYKRGGFVAPHRFVILSNTAKCIDDFSEHPEWGLCVWPTGRLFKVIDKVSSDGLTQITLLEIPENLLPTFQSQPKGFSFEANLVEQARMDIEETRKMPPLPELDTDLWRDRLTYPIGIDSHGKPFPV